MGLFDIFEMALANAGHLADQCAGHAAVVVEFAQIVEKDGRLSVTMRLDRLRDFLGGGHFLNPWEECYRDAGGDPKAAEQLMADRQKEWYGRRALFEGSFDGGKLFRYGALYTRGRGLIDSRYGPFCSVFRADAADAWKRVAWLPANSLKRYVPDDRTFNVERLRGEVGAHGARHQVAAIKHAEDVAVRPQDEWPTLLCQGDRFVEGIVAEDLVPAAVERLLVDTAFWSVLQDAADAVLDGDAVTPQTQADAGRFAEIRAALKKWDLQEEMV
ncbi:MAG: hypothetical protein QM820_28150 [Minicystis sp.]